MKKCLLTLLGFLLFISSSSIPTANAVITNPTPVCVSGTCTINFDTTNDYYLWSAPAAGTYTFQVWGAQGGSALNTNGTVAQTGPLGGYASGNYTLTSGQTLYIYVGGQGAGSTNQKDAIAGGFNGGGIGYNGNASARAASGGGASDIRIGGNALSNRVIVAGAGGGGRYFPGYGAQAGGHGGGTSGGNGDSGGVNSGQGGTQSAGGAGGQNGGTASSGTSGNGGNGVSLLHDYGSSGGGGGYFGGGGAGVGFTPGGGSGFVGGVTSSTITAGNASMPNPAGGNMIGRSGNGYIRITYTFDATPPAFTLFELAGGTKFATYRSAIVITATVTLASKMTFRANGKVLPGCKNKTTSGSGSIFTATCSWKPSVRGSVALLATADPIADGIDNATSNSVSVGVSSRRDKR